MIFSNDCWMKEYCKAVKINNCFTEDHFCKKLFRIDSLYNNSLLSPIQRKRIYFTYDDGYAKEKHDLQEIQNKVIPIQNNILSFVENGNSLFFHSTNCGNGKTAWSTRLLQEYLENIWYKVDVTKSQALFISVPRFLLTLKDNISDKSDYIQFIKNNVLDVGLVVWDEVGVKSLTPYEHENLFNLINTRIDMGKANIYTSNLSDTELQEKIGERLYSRIVNLSTIVEFYGADKRGIK